MRRSILSIMMMSIVFVVSGIVAVAQEESAQKNKQTYLDVVAEYNAGNHEAFYNMVTDPFMMNQGDATLYEAAIDDIRGYDGALTAAMPDIQMNVDVAIAQGEWVAVHVTNSGTFTEPFQFIPFGPDAFEPNNAEITWTELTFLHYNADGLVDTVWLTGDPFALFGQMGIFPPMGDEGDDTQTVLEQPAGYQTLSADELTATFTSGMEEQNAALFQEQINIGLGSDTISYYADNYVSWQNGVPHSVDAAVQGPQDQAFFGLLTQAMPDSEIETPVVVAEGDWVAVLVQFSGTFTEDVTFFDGTPLSATNQPIEWQIGLINRFDTGGKIIEELVESDITPLLGGLGLMPPMGEGQ